MKFLVLILPALLVIAFDIWLVATGQTTISDATFALGRRYPVVPITFVALQVVLTWHLFGPLFRGPLFGGRP